MNKREGLGRLRYLVACYIGVACDIDTNCNIDDFINLRNYLKKISKEASIWTGSGDNKYLFKSIIVFYDSINHLTNTEAEKLTPEKRSVIRKTANKICKCNIKRNDFERIYNSLLRAGFNIIPFPGINTTPR